VTAHGGSEVLKLVEVDVADPGPDSAHCNHAIGLNFIDIYYRTGLYPAATPHGLASRGAGVVDAVGSNAAPQGRRSRRLRPGQRRLRWRAWMPAATVVKLPAKISFEEGAAVMLKGLTVQYLFRQTYRLQGNETILFHAAAGGVGLIACQWAKALGVRLIGTVSSPEKAALAKKHGAWQTIDYSKENFVERV
jgi:NADPH2:quinone reductase